MGVSAEERRTLMTAHTRAARRRIQPQGHIFRLVGRYSRREASYLAVRSCMRSLSASSQTGTSRFAVASLVSHRHGHAHMFVFATPQTSSLTIAFVAHSTYFERRQRRHVALHRALGRGIRSDHFIFPTCLNHEGHWLHTQSLPGWPPLARPAGSSS
jgi:hypothetical protein